eukprot:COSAG04_NODE_12609_length_644_cov_0.660550_1_plen_76_part_10
MGFTSVISNSEEVAGEVSGFHYGNKPKDRHGKKLSTVRVVGAKTHDDTVQLTFTDGSTHLVHLRAGRESKHARVHE